MTGDIKAYILAEVAKNPYALIKNTAAHFNLTPQAIQKHVAQLVAAGVLRKEGNTRSTAYYLNAAPEQARLSTPKVGTNKSTITIQGRPLAVAQGEWRYAVTKELSEQDIWDSTLKKELGALPQNIREIAEYGFTEMVNNVKDHSSATELRVNYWIEDGKLNIVVSDNGIGIFKKLKDTLGLPTLKEAVLHLSKGKLTTDHTRHTGEGIFFTSRVFDEFLLVANGLLFGRINTEEDWLLGEEEDKAGTRVRMDISLTSSRTRDEVFKRYTSPEDFSFSKTHVAVELGLTEGETYVSRSQAKRILSGLDKFKFIILNFKRVKTVGQGFVDEVFRVFQNAHPDIEISVINANDAVDFMIKRSKQTGV
ncbi:MAG: DUF4325 domain-containing protein [Bdellovibrionales bacterium]|nr:DUF4325 domain-containing protein [Bdellovibrionales bacterium]